MTTDGAGEDKRGDGSTRTDENFLSRWSRRKIEAREAVAAPATVVPPPDRADEPASGDPSSVAPAAEPLPPVESLHGLEGEYTGFLKPEVDDVLRRSALKKLFADPHFNVIDVNEAYSGDWASSTPIPAAALAMMEQAKHLLVDPDEPRKDAKESKDKEAEAPSSVADSTGIEGATADPVEATHTEVPDNAHPEGSAEETRPAPQHNA